MMRSEAEEAASLVEWEVSMRLTKRELGRRMIKELSLLLVGRRSGQQERASRAERSFPGMWIILKSKSVIVQLDPYPFPPHVTL